MTVEAALPPLRSARTQILVLLVSLGHCATHWVPATFFLLLPGMGRELGLNYTETGLLVTAFYVGSTVSNLPSGIIVDLTGRRILIQVLALLFGSAMLAALGVATSFAGLWACVALLGAANMLWHPAAISYLSSHLPHNRGYSMAMHSVFANIGDAAAPVLAGWLLLSLSWQTTAEINALTGVVAALAIVLVLGRSDRGAAAVRPPPLRDDWRGLVGQLVSRTQWSFFLMAGFRTMTQAGLLAFLPLYLSHDLGMSSFAMGIAMMMLQLGGIVATPLAGMLSDRIGRRPIVLAGMTGTTVLVVVLTFIADPVVYASCISVLGFVMYAMRPVIQSWQMDRSPPELLASVTSAMFTVQAVLSALAPIIGGALADRFGLISVFYFLAASVLLANIFTFMVPKTEHGD
jgi:MFS family permease